MALYFITQADRGYIADDHLLITQLARFGAAPIPLPWTQGLGGIAPEDTLVIRAIWDYHLRPKEFEGWLETTRQIGCRLINPERLIRWNYRKTYLQELAQSGIHSPETFFYRSPLDFTAQPPPLAHPEYVVKPIISASAYRTIRVPASSLADTVRAFPPGEFMIQEFLPEIAAGEWSLIFIGGTLTHALKKVPAAGEFRSQREFGGTTIAGSAPVAAVEEATRIIALLPDEPAYARIDLVIRDGVPLLIEVELIEPELFLATNPHAAERLARIMIDT